MLEVADGDVRPNVAVKINQDRVQTNEILEEFSHIVMGLNLGGHGVPIELQGFNESPANALPVKIRVSNGVCIEVAHRTIHLPQDWLFAHLLELSVESGNDVHQLFANGGRGCWLTMGSSHHGDIAT